MSREVTAFEPARSDVVEADNHGCRYRSEFVFAAKDEGTEVTMTFDAKPYTFGAKLMSPLGKLMAGTVRKECARDMDALKLFAEQA